jgi:N-acetylglutamate synthase-like GNAT family acetyltransferase
MDWVYLAQYTDPGGSLLACFAYIERKKKEACEITLLCVNPNVARQQFGKHVLAATNTYVTIEKLLDAVFSVLVVLHEMLSM